MILYYILCLFFICLIFYIIYLSIKSKKEKFTLTTTPSCSNSLVPCVNGQCINCSSDFECVTIDETSENYMFNGGKVPIGSYCLPKKTGRTNCNRYTGRWVWTAGETSQTWKCECLYPNLFYGEECTIQKACNNDIYPNPSPELSNKLIGNPNISDVKNKVWDPQFSGADVLMINPYKTDINGEPYFICQCNQTDPIMKNFPNIPYTCNPDTCWRDQKTSSLQINEDGTMLCDCDANTGGSVVTDSTASNKGTCFRDDLVCGVTNTYDQQTQSCKCTNSNCAVKCTNGFGVTGEPNWFGNIIQCPGNEVGRTCYNTCNDPNTCDPLGTASCIPDCDMKISYKCNCKDIPAGPKYSGDNCNSVCLNQGAFLGTCRTITSGKVDHVDCDWTLQKKCCSGSAKKPELGGSMVYLCE